jgi:NADH-quinone oxidoreductase subunit G
MITRRIVLASAAALAGKPGATASVREVLTAPAILVIGNDPTEQHPLLAYQIRNNVRLNKARLYVVNADSIKLRRQATLFAQVPRGGEGAFASYLAGDDASAPSVSRERANARRSRCRRAS